MKINKFFLYYFFINIFIFNRLKTSAVASTLSCLGLCEFLKSNNRIQEEDKLYAVITISSSPHILHTIISYQLTLRSFFLIGLYALINSGIVGYCKGEKQTLYLMRTSLLYYIIARSTVNI